MYVCMYVYIYILLHFQICKWLFYASCAPVWNTGCIIVSMSPKSISTMLSHYINIIISKYKLPSKISVPIVFPSNPRKSHLTPIYIPFIHHSLSPSKIPHSRATTLHRGRQGALTGAAYSGHLQPEIPETEETPGGFSPQLSRYLPMWYLVI